MIQKIKIKYLEVTRAIKQHSIDKIHERLAREGKLFDPDYHPYINYNPALLEKKEERKPRIRKKKKDFKEIVSHDEKLRSKVRQFDVIQENGSIVFEARVYSGGSKNVIDGSVPHITSEDFENLTEKFNLSNPEIVANLELIKEYFHLGYSAKETKDKENCPYSISHIKLAFSCFRKSLK